MNQDDDKPRIRPLPADPLVPPAAGEQRRVSLAQAMALAEQHQSGARLPQAETVLREILQAQPKHAPALHLLGIVAHQQGQTRLGVQLLGEAIEIDPSKSLFHANRGEMYRQLGDLDEAIASGERALKLEPRSVAALSNTGIAYFDQKDLEKAEDFQQRALQVNPNFAPALNNLGSICRGRKDTEGAIGYYRKVLETQPDYVESVNNLGAVLTEDDRPEEALPILQKAIQMRPGYADAHCNIGLALLSLEQYDKAFARFNQALKLRPDYLEAHIGAARVLQQSDRLPAAEKVAERALELAPDRPEVHNLLGGLYAETGYPDRAAAAYDKALELDDESRTAYIGKGNLLMEFGELDEAEGCFQHALDLKPDNMAARLSLIQVKKVTAGDENMAALVSEMEKSASLPKLKATAYHFALGKCYDDVGEYDKAFPHFTEGGRLKRSGLNYDPGDTEQLVTRIATHFDAATMDRLRGAGDPSEVPVFVLGMARSGTTLTEQIIASHPQAYGAGELPDLLDLAANPKGLDAQHTDNQPRYPETMQGLMQADMHLLGTRYVEGLAARAPEAVRITDKMPANFFCIGLIHLMLPNAKIVHVRRNPLDTCLSGYSRLFAKGQPHSYDLTELGRYYRAYAQLMDHWRSVLPDGAMLEVQYEELVNDHEPQARRLIDYCGLEWDDVCLDFHKTDRSIRTASVTQVRQPIYNTSLERWRHYDAFLDPLFDALGDLAPKRD